MDFTSIIALSSSMLLLALIPGPSALLVCSRTLGGGPRSGIATIAGVLSSDYIFIVIAILGLSVLAELMGQAFFWIKIIGATYLVYLGSSLLFCKKSSPDMAKTSSVDTLLNDYIAGLLVTLSNPKAILFYASLFPTFVSLHNLSHLDLLIIILIATLVLGAVLLLYVWLTVLSKNTTQNKIFARLNYLPIRKETISGGVLLASGVWIATRSN
jgi:threonine/homoserine/homoserine lactone efflux protein